MIFLGPRGCPSDVLHPSANECEVLAKLWKYRWPGRWQSWTWHLNPVISGDNKLIWFTRKRPWHAVKNLLNFFCCQLRSLSLSSKPSQSTFQGRSEIKDVGSKLTKAISAFAYQPIKCSQKQIKANEILNLARQRSLCSQKLDFHIQTLTHIYQHLS